MLFLFMGGVIFVEEARSASGDWPALYGYLASERWEEAIAFAEAIDLYRLGDGEDLYSVSIAFKFDGDFSTSERYLRRAVALSGRDPRYLYELASVQYARGAFDDSEENFLAVLSTRPPAQARREIYRFLRDIRADDNTRWDIDYLFGRESNVSSSFSPTQLYGINFKPSESRRSAWYADITPSFYVQRELSEGSSVWLRPSFPLRWVTDSDYSSYGFRLGGGLNLSRGRDLVRPSLTWSYSDSQATLSAYSWTARLSWRRQFGRFTSEPYAEHRFRRREGVEYRPRDKEYGIILMRYFSPQTVLTVTPSYSYLANTTSFYEDARRRSLDLSLRMWRGTWSFTYRFFVARTKHDETILTPQKLTSPIFALRLPSVLPARSDKRERLSFSASNEDWDVNGFVPEVTLFTDKSGSNDPTISRPRETGITIGFNRLF
ncbi:MAG: tetratricopeptide repeat protein [Alphaproteobacteria bacterium]